ncbi:MAG: aldose 1-epimerase [Cytophagales bacterium]|nr:aldose 1-epimerase [Cytophagales bacterium]MDW8383579.1 aldose 1-epimerase [Flammeovirgaceae bacterium]
MFTLKKESFGQYERITLQNVVTGHAMTILPAYGANLMGLNLFHTPLIDGILAPEEIGNNRFYKSAFLFPYPNRTRNGQYEFEGKHYQLYVNETTINTALHGFVYYQPFEVVDIIMQQEIAAIELHYKYQGDQPGYPFRAVLEIIYSISVQRGLKVDVRIRNIGNTNLPLGFGWHPYFMLEVPINELEIRIPRSQRYRLDHQMCPTGEKSFFDAYLQSTPLGNNFFDDCFAIEKNGEKAETHLYSPSSRKKLIVWQETGNSKFNYLQIFTPSHRNSIAIEPMTCSVNAFNTKEGLIVLKPSEVFEGSFGVQLEIL